MRKEDKRNGAYVKEGEDLQIYRFTEDLPGKSRNLRNKNRWNCKCTKVKI